MAVAEKVQTDNKFDHNNSQEHYDPGFLQDLTIN